ncbi:flagellar hook-length control protein FliK [Rhizobium sp. CSW-27]|uniref:flagellar hook-length control protein FliK n=1 Tax=Rhizobium sp. CSW-27 TaxID=2839985 RepID=UPI001C030F2F|nr:flagellar hook-length control protein FliK [Rhizobium sp. CSW-27]MBT9371927.1 flagellar hook-length control protein FliK [Rhizobium sp. CSW-27]
MVAVDVPTRAAAGDPTSASRISSGARSEGGEGGFGSALESLEQGSRRAADDRAGRETQADSDAGTGVSDTDETGSTPRVELSAATLARSRALAAMQAGLSSEAKTGKAAGGVASEAGLDKAADREGLRSRIGKTAAATDVSRRGSTGDGETASAEAADGGKGEAAETVQASTAPDGLTSVLSMLAGASQADATLAGRQAGAATRASGRQAGEDKQADRSQAVASAAEAELAALSGEPQSLDLPSGQTLSTDERTFRFSSSRGKGASMEMIIGTGRDGLASVETRSATTGQAETIAVLDSRRFLGFGQSVNGAALTAAMSGDPEWAGAMQPGASLSNAAAQSSTGNVVNTLKLQMTPIDLGTVTATLRLVGDELNVQLTVETRAAHKQLTQDSSGILDALRAQGFSVDQVTVSIAPSSSVTQAAQQDGPGQQTAAGSGQGQGGQPGREQQSSQPGGGSTAGMFENEAATDHGAAGTGGARPDHLYV